MKKILLPGIVLLTAGCLPAQNVGIDVANPQQKLHVNGNIRVEALAIGDGLVKVNSNGDLAAYPNSGNANMALLGNGTWGTVPGTIPASGLAVSKIYNNTSLIAAGFTLAGELPAITYSTSNGAVPANSWQPTYTRGIAANTSAPVYNSNSGEAPVALWSGTLMYVSTFTNLYSYNPATDVWAVVSNQGVGNSLGTNAVWTGSEIIYYTAYGGTLSGKKYSPATNTWTNISTAGMPESRYNHTMIWDGTRIIVWGGYNSSTGLYLNNGAMYNPATNSWTAISNVNAPSARAFHTAVWSTVNNRMIVWGGFTGGTAYTNTGALFDPVTNTWTAATSLTNAPAVRGLHSATWTGTEMIILGGYNGTTGLNTGGRYNPATNVWTATGTASAAAVYDHSACWTGTAVFVSGGQPGVTSTAAAYTYTPATDTWGYLGQYSDVSTEGKSRHHSFYTGGSNSVLIWGGSYRNASPPASNWSNTGYRYYFTGGNTSATSITSQTIYLYIKN